MTTFITAREFNRPLAKVIMPSAKMYCSDIVVAFCAIRWPKNAFAARKNDFCKRSNQNPSAVAKAAEKGVVFITYRGKPKLKVESLEETGPTAKKSKNLVDLIGSNPEVAEIDFEPPRMSDDMGLKIPDFS